MFAKRLSIALLTLGISASAAVYANEPAPAPDVRVMESDLSKLIQVRVGQTLGVFLVHPKTSGWRVVGQLTSLGAPFAKVPREWPYGGRDATEFLWRPTAAQQGNKAITLQKFDVASGRASGTATVHVSVQ